MAILDRAARNARALIRSAEWGDSSIPPPGAAGGFPVSGNGSGEGAALAIGTVLACMKALFEDTSVLPFAAYTGDPNGQRTRLRVQPQIVSEPFGPDTDPGDGLGQLVVSKAMRGNAYLFVISRGDDGFPTQLRVLHPDQVQVRWDKALGKRFKIQGTDYGPTEVIHMPGFMLPGALEGVDVLTYQRTTHELAWSVNKYGTAFFGGGGSPAGVISVKGSGDRKKAREVLATWDATHGGPANAHRPAVMFGDSTWTPMSVTPDNAQFLETRRFLREEICGLYGVPLQRIQAIVENASQGGGKGLDAIDAGYVKHGLLTAHGPIMRAWSRMIPGDQGSWCAMDYDEFLRANAEIRAAVAQIHRVTAIRTPDEIRADYGWAPLPDGVGANPFVPLNSNASPTGGADNAPAPGGQGGNPA